MASVPPSLQHTSPQDTTPRRLNSAPPTDSMSATVNRSSTAIGQDGEHTFETAGTSPAQDPAPAVVKTEPQAGTSGLQTIPAGPSDMDLKQHEDSPKEEHKASDLPLKDHPQQPQPITLDNVRKAADATDLVTLEAYTEVARQVLDSIRQPLADSKQRDQQEWLKRADTLKAKSQRLRTVVAVAGATGAGKSSLINALLDEEKLLPTSGFRACTAVITEISYNESDDPRKAYRAEIEFISQDDWVSTIFSC